MHNSKFVTNKAAGRHRRLCLRKIPDIDVCVLLIFRLARGSCAVAFLGNCDTENLKYVSVQLLLFRPQSPRHKNIFDWRLVDFDDFFLFVSVCENCHGIKLTADAPLFFVIHSQSFVG